MESKRIELKDRIEWQNERGELHCLDGPAIEYISGNKYWYIDGYLHREDGPAIELISGTKSWFLNGIRYSEERWKEEVIKLKLKRIKDL